MVALVDLVTYLRELLACDTISDYCPNGLQVEGRPEIATIIGGVTACQPLLDAAVAVDADAVLVHHGYFWKGEVATVTGMKRRRLATLLGHDISLLAYHLPLDVHALYGNNVQLARVLEFNIERSLGSGSGPDLVMVGTPSGPLTAGQLSQRLALGLGQTPLHIGETDAQIQRVAWCTGAAQSYLDSAVQAGADAYITGEVSEPTVHTARESGIQFFAAGHHATERYGVQALGAHLSEHFGVTFEFVDVPNPV
jgi:dinuclear metal center YbgI/SA1388 family protein